MGMRGTVSLDMVLKDVFVPDEGDVLPAGLFGAMYNAFPHLSPLTFSATFLGIMQASWDFTVAYLTGKIPGAPGLQTEAATKGQAVAEMLFTLEAARALYYRAIAEAQVDAPVAAVQRAVPRTSPCNAPWSPSPRKPSGSAAGARCSSAIRWSASRATRGPAP